jgi:hypothetical protein
MDLHVVTAHQADPRLGRHVVHDPRSRRFAYPVAAEPRPTRRFRHRIYGPQPVPAQRIGCSTGVDQCVKANAVGNRIKGQVLGLGDAVAIYARATQLDPWPEEYPPTDTGSSALAACKAAAERGLIERYEWLFGGVDRVLTALIAHPIGVGTWWYREMFQVEPDTLLVHPTGTRVGGHQWTLVGWDPRLDAFEGLCWWGPTFGRNGLFRIRRADLAALLADDGDAHVAYRKF